MLVSEAMARTIRVAQPGDTVGDVARWMREEDTGFMPVADGSQLVGVVTDRDLVVRCLADQHENPLSEPISHCMHGDPVSIASADDIEAAAELMASRGVRRLPVVESGRLVGIISHGNLVQATHGDGPGREATVGVTRGA